MYFVWVLEGYKFLGCLVECGFFFYGKRWESVGVFFFFICGLEKNCLINKMFFYCFFFFLDDIIIMYREWVNCIFVEVDKVL